MAKMGPLYTRRGSGIRICLATLISLSSGCSSDHRALTAPKVAGAGFGTTWDIFPLRQDSPAWSSQGQIAYRDNGVICVDQHGAYSTDSSLTGLWILNPQSSAKHRLLPYGEDPSWSPDGRRLTFEASGQIFVINADGSGLSQLTHRGANFYPCFDYGGNEIAYDSDGGSDLNPYSIWAMSAADGSNQRILCNLTWARMASMRPRGSGLAFIAAGDSGTSGLEVWTADSLCIRTRLTYGGGHNATPRYMPSGRSIAFSSQSNIGGLPQIWVMNADGNGPRQLTSLGGVSPSWSANGDSLVYVRYDPFENTPDRNVLWVMDVATGAGHQLLSQWPQQCP